METNLHLLSPNGKNFETLLEAKSSTKSTSDLLKEVRLFRRVQQDRCEVTTQTWRLHLLSSIPGRED
jgi:hypothetical protein